MSWVLPQSTGRIRLRRLRTDDLMDFLVYRSDPVVARYQGWDLMTRQAALDFLSREAQFTELVPGGWSQLGVTRANNDALIGDVGLWLSPDSSTVEIGVSLARHAQGQGLGSHTLHGLISLVFSATAVTNIVAHTDARNEPCIRALKRAGLLQTGTRTEIYKGEACTEVCFLVERSAFASATRSDLTSINEPP